MKIDSPDETPQLHTVEITLKSGALVLAEVEEFTVEKDLTGLSKISWIHGPNDRLLHVAIDEIAAIVTHPAPTVRVQDLCGAPGPGRHVLCQRAPGHDSWHEGIDWEKPYIGNPLKPDTVRWGAAWDAEQARRGEGDR